ILLFFIFFFQAEDGIRDRNVTGVQTCALPIFSSQRLLLFWCYFHNSYFGYRQQCNNLWEETMKKYFSFKKTAMASLFGVTLLGVAASVTAQTTLRIGDSLPSGHYIAEGLIEFWMDGVKEKLGDDVDVDHFLAVH